jgi:hypothetical protein
MRRSHELRSQTRSHLQNEDAFKAGIIMISTDQKVKAATTEAEQQSLMAYPDYVSSLPH